MRAVSGSTARANDVRRLGANSQVLAGYPCNTRAIKGQQGCNINVILTAFPCLSVHFLSFFGVHGPDVKNPCNSMNCRGLKWLRE